LHTDAGRAALEQNQRPLCELLSRETAPVIVLHGGDDAFGR
jgi:hypothetical protein